MTTVRTKYSLGAILKNDLLARSNNAVVKLSLIRSNLQGANDLLKRSGLKKQSENKQKPFLQVITGFNSINLCAKRVIFIAFESKINISAMQWFSDSSSMRFSGFVPLGMEYFCPIFQRVLEGGGSENLLPESWKEKGEIYFKGTRIVNGDGELIIPYIDYSEEFMSWQAGFKNASEILPDTKEARRTLGICILKPCSRKGIDKRSFSEMQEV